MCLAQLLDQKDREIQRLKALVSRGLNNGDAAELAKVCVGYVVYREVIMFFTTNYIHCVSLLAEQRRIGN